MPIATVNPATGEVVETYAPHDATEVERRISAAADLLDAEAESSAAMLTLEMGKPLRQAATDGS